MATGRKKSAMKMRRSTAWCRVLLGALLTLAALPLAAQEAPAAPSHLAAAKQLLEVTHVKELMDTSATQMLDVQLQQAPQLAPFADIMRDFYREQMKWDVLEPEFVRLYTEVFSEQELHDLIAFYGTPLGKMMQSKMPLLMQKSNELTQRRLQAALPQLMQRMQAAAQKMQAPPDSAKGKAP
jgi:hypothetical protein